MPEDNLLVDSHAHLVPPALIDALSHAGRRLGVWIETDEHGCQRAVFADSFRTYYPFFPNLVDLPTRLRELNARGIGIQILAPWMDLVGYGLEAWQGQELSRLANETLAELVRQYPSRLRGVATVPLQEAHRAADELGYAVRQLGFRAVQIGTNVNGRNLDDAALDPFWTACQELDAFVFIHPHRVAAADRLTEYFTSNLLGNPFETTLAAASLLFGGVFERFPTLKVCLAHAGGFLPYQLGRLDHGYAVKPEARRRAPRPPSAYLDHFYFDTLSHFEPALTYLLDLVGPERLLFGTDMPFPMADPRMRERLEHLPALPPADHALILNGNASRLFGLSVPEAESRG